MPENSTPHPPIATAEEWQIQRDALLVREKAHTRENDAINAARRRLPMVKLEKPYTFEGDDGPCTLPDLFGGNRQLIVYHFMFDPEWDEACGGCTSQVDAFGDLSMLGERNTTLVLVSRAPLPKLQVWKQNKGWTMPWYSSFGSDFNRDFLVTKDTGEASGLSVFFQLDGDIYHTYSTYARGVENLVHTYPLLDVTPYGRQEDFEDSPKGWPQKPTYG